jgi:hypothetical protein
MLDKLFDINGIIGTIYFVLIMGVLFMLVSELQESPLGQNEQANKTLEETKSTLRILTSWYFIAGSIGSIATLVLFFL